MRVSLSNVESAPAYSEPATLRLAFARRLVFQVANAAIFYQLDESPDGNGTWTKERFLAPSIGSFDRVCSGVRIRSAVATAPARVSLELLDELDLTGGADSFAPFTSTVAADGGVSTGPSMILTGRVNADGTIAGGTGFTVAFNGLSTYTITFTTPFAALPVVAVQATNASGAGLSGVTASQFVVTTQGAAPAPFNFLAVPTT